MRRAWVCIVLVCAVRAEAQVVSVRIAPEADDPTRVVATYDLAATATGRAILADFDAVRGDARLRFSLVDEAAAPMTLGEPVFGSYRRVGTQIEFRPKFGLVRGSTYAAYWLSSSEGADVEAMARYTVPSVPAPTKPVVRRIHPGGDRIPANVLRFYIEFSQPMREGREVLEQIHLLDDRGEAVVEPWRDLEAWSADARRLTLFLHPGRIKQGVNLREQLGPILEPGRRYVLVVPGTLRDASGTPLGADVHQSFDTGAELHRRIDLAEWRVHCPARGTREPFVVDFGRPLDGPLAARAIELQTADGRSIARATTLSEDQTRWIVEPRTPWDERRYAIVVDPLLEDACGNTPLRAFDFDRTTDGEVMPASALRREIELR